MKRYIKAAIGSYSKILKTIEKKLRSQNRNAYVNKSDSCVDVFDDKGNVIEQHYPVQVDDVESSRGKFQYVGEGNGDYICTQVKYAKKRYTDENHRVKKVSEVYFE